MLASCPSALPVLAALGLALWHPHDAPITPTVPDAPRLEKHGEEEGDEGADAAAIGPRGARRLMQAAGG